MQIRCPHCATALRLGEPQPGRYRPKCRRCGKPFVVHIREGAEPQVTVGRADDPGRPGKPDARRNADATAKRRPPDANAHAPGEARPEAARTSPGQSDIPPPAARKSAAAKPAAGKSAAVPGQRVTRGVTGELPPPNEPEPVPSWLGGYRIVRLLGRGAMGAVYQAKQVSLDRDVALKTIRGRWAEDASSLARFTREAYAAAQLAHHNVVQIYDFGEDRGQQYFSMEWVRGGSLADLVREKGRLDPKLAATYLLQAARGLQGAHRAGMVHRDVKPSNLLLAEDGVVKVADLGLVKVPDLAEPEPNALATSTANLQSGTEVTLQGTAVGTPAYMAPEQCRDASKVDHRADIYSLGCCLFYLLAGEPPYPGTDFSDVTSQHLHAPPPDLGQVNPRVPQPLCRVVARAMVKRPQDRYASLGEMIDELESFLGVEPWTGFSPRREDADRWETLATRYAQTQTLRRLTQPLLVALIAVAAALTLGMLLVAPWYLLLGPTLLVATVLAAVALATTVQRNAIAEQFRRWLTALSWFERLASLVTFAVVWLLMMLSGLWIGVVVGVLLGVGLGAAYHGAITVTSVRAGAEPLAEARRFVRDQRLGGANEHALRDFLARYAGKHWQGIYEALFGYQALNEARQRYAGDPSFDGPLGGHRWRDRFCGLLARKTASNREAENRKKLARVERRSLVSQGWSESEATRQSWQVASAIMEAAQLKAAREGGDERAVADAKRKRIKAMLADARSGRYRRPRDRFAAPKFAFSGYTRMLTGSLLLVIFALLAYGTETVTDETLDQVQRGRLDWTALPLEATTGVLGVTTNVWSIGLAGGLLCLSAFVSGWRMTPFAAAATVVILFGASWGVPAIGPAADWMVAAGIGLVIYLPGVIYGEVEEDAS